ncbi:MAG: antitoxin family protein [Candidatus Competibacteraceae bacterium]
MDMLLKAVYENGVFRPLEAVTLPEHQEVTLAVHQDESTPTEDDRNAYDLA